MDIVVRAAGPQDVHLAGADLIALAIHNLYLDAQRRATAGPEQFRLTGKRPAVVSGGEVDHGAGGLGHTVHLDELALEDLDGTAQYGFRDR